MERILDGRTVTGAISARMTIDGRSYRNFFGANYLALGAIAEIRDAARLVLDSGASLGQSLPASHGAIDPIFKAAEDTGARVMGRPRALYFASGYLIGAVGLAALHDQFDLILLDQHAHFNIRDAARASQKSCAEFAHCDPADFEALLRKTLPAGAKPLLATDGVFATTGRVAPLADYARVLKNYGGALFVDESHAFGVVGANGRGASEYCGVEALTGATLSKAYCAFGALVGCTQGEAERARLRPPISGATAGSPPLAAASTAALNYVDRHPALRTTLSKNATTLRRRVQSMGYDVAETPAPIVSFEAGSFSDMRALQRRAFDAGIYLHHSIYIGAGAAGMIRCAVFADHSEADFEALIEVLRKG